MRRFILSACLLAAVPCLGSRIAAAQDTPPAPTTNVGTDPDTNIQNPNLEVNALADTELPAEVVKSGTLSYSLQTIKQLAATASCPKTVSTKKKGSVSAVVDLSDPALATLINIIRLAKPASSGAPQAVTSSNWYIYSNQTGWYRGWYSGWEVSDFDGSKRLYGAKRILLLAVIVGDQAPETPQLTYKLTIKKVLPSNVASALALIGAALGPATSSLATVQKPNFIGCAAIPVAYQTSSIQVDSSFKISEANPTTTSLTFTNESKEWWDVSFALPVKKASALQFNSTSNAVTPAEVNKQALYAVVDLYIPEADLAGKNYSFIPHPFAGVAMNSQPLHSLIFGGSVGLHLAEVYAGALLLKQQDTATGPYQYKASFSVGVKISVKAAVDAFSAKM